MIYFDNAASARPLPEAIETMAALARDGFANPSALHKGGIASESVIDASKKIILSKLGLAGNIIFTSSATESNNLAIFGTLNKNGKRGGRKIITTSVEHPSVSEALNRLEISENFEIIRVPPLSISDVAAYADENTALVSVTAVCSETGYVTGVKELYERIKAVRPNVIFHTDAAQGFLKTELDGDLISLSAHKIGGICGVGALFVKDGVKLTPQMFGGGQQKGLRPGTEPVALIGAFGKAAEVGEYDARPLYERLTSGLKSLQNVKINSPGNVPNIVNFSTGVPSEVMLNFLSERGVYVSAGSACSRGKRSKVLPVYGVSESDIGSAIRVSFGKQNTLAEADEFLNILSEGLKKLYGNNNGKIRGNRPERPK